MNLKWVWITGLFLLVVVPHLLTLLMAPGPVPALFKFAAWWCGLGMVSSGLMITYGGQVSDD